MWFTQNYQMYKTHKVVLEHIIGIIKLILFAWYLQVLVYPWTPSNVVSRRPTISLDSIKCRLQTSDKNMKDEMKEDQALYSRNISALRFSSTQFSQNFN